MNMSRYKELINSRGSSSRILVLFLVLRHLFSIFFFPLILLSFVFSCAVTLVVKHMCICCDLTLRHLWFFKIHQCIFCIDSAITFN